MLYDQALKQFSNMISAPQLAQQGPKKLKGAQKWADLKSERQGFTSKTKVDSLNEQAPRIQVSISSFNFKFHFKFFNSSFNFKFQFQVSISSLNFKGIPSPKSVFTYVLEVHSLSKTVSLVFHITRKTGRNQRKTEKFS